MKIWMTTALIHDANINGKIETCVLKYIGGYSFEELKTKLSYEKAVTNKINLRLDEEINIVELP